MLWPLPLSIVNECTIILLPAACTCYLHGVRKIDTVVMSIVYCIYSHDLAHCRQKSDTEISRFLSSLHENSAVLLIAVLGVLLAGRDRERQYLRMAHNRRAVSK